MNRPYPLYLVLTVAMALGAAGCSKGGNASSDASPSADATAVATALASPSPSSSSVASPAAGVTTSPAAFTDIAGVNGEKEIEELAVLGAVDPASGAFNPGAPVKRREFIRWLVKANNALWSDAPTKFVHLADKTEASSFPDVATTDPDFPFIQGMQNAGFSVGFPDKTFKPEQTLTREQMFAIKNIFDRGSVDPGLAKDLTFARNTVMPPWKDKESISKTYVAAIATGAGGGSDSFSRVYGVSAFFHPQLAVTRAQAAVAVSVVGDHIFSGGAQRTAAQPPATPTP